ncbi:MAG: GH92 family glycosyl hydrolase [Myxococcota bacterium]
MVATTTHRGAARALAAGLCVTWVLSGCGGAGDQETDVTGEPAEAPLVQWVDPFIGTGGLGFGVGSAFPGPQRPFGMARPGPDTALGENGAAPFYHCSGYYYDDTHIRGFSQIRPHGMGVPDYGAVGLMPTVGMSPEKTSVQGHLAPFSHDTEEASPGYYAVTLSDPEIRVELTSTERVALHRYTFPQGSDAVVLIDIGHYLADLEVVDGSVTVDPEAREVHGFARVDGAYSGRYGGVPVQFVARFDRPFESHGVWQGDALMDGETATQTGPDTGAYLRFDASSDPVVEVAVGLSFVDVEHARMNLDAEVPELDFDAVRLESEQAWENTLSVVEIWGHDEHDFRLFYTALYHALLMPTRADDVDGSYRGVDGEVHQADGFRYYTDFSLWDTYRTQHPLLVLLYPDYQRDFLRSLAAMARDGGYMPRWPLGVGYTGGMVGESATLVFADSWLKGLQDFDLRAAYDAMRATAMGPTPAGAPYGGRGGITEYLELGYVPIENGGGSASKTLEYAYDDFALALLADALGESSDRDAFEARAESWRNLYDEATGFLVGRYADGTFAPVDPYEWEDYYTEGNAQQYTWFVPHDLEGLADAMGGRDALLDRLQRLFESSEQEVASVGPRQNYWHGNEPDIHYPWIWSALDRPAGTARWTRWVIDTMYGDGPDGLPGNDDAGTLSAWLVFASLGMYPITATDHYLLGSPIFTRAVLHLPEGDFEIVAADATRDTPYVTGARLGGAALDRARLPHAEMANGGRLELDMAAEPAGWGETTP